MSSAALPARRSPRVKTRQVRKPAVTMRRVDTIMIVAIAFTDGNGAARVAASIWIGTVSVGPPLDSHWLMTKSSAEMANTTAAEATIAGVSKGRRTRVNGASGEG